MPRLHQYHFSVTPHDAVTNHMSLIHRTLGAHAGKVFATQLGTGTIGMEHFRPHDIAVEDLLLIHHSHGNPVLPEVLATNCRKALVYHNVTPAEFFTHDPVAAHLSRLGRDQLPLFRGVVEQSFADSQYNAAELATLGFTPPKLLPLLALENLAPSRVLGETKVEFHLLFVGRITPHKNQALLIRVLAELVAQGLGPASLTLVGGADPIYRSYLTLLAERLGVKDRVQICGKIDEAEKERLYQTRSAFVCPSLHEGYCIPLVEAMRWGIPIFALARAAVPETLGPCGVLFDTDAPEAIAYILGRVLKERAVVQTILDRQAERLRDLQREQNTDTLRKILLAVLERRTL